MLNYSLGMGKWKGIIIEDSLKNKNILRNIKITKTHVIKPKNTTEKQPNIWHEVEVFIDDKDLNQFCKKLQHAIKTGPWYVDFETDNEGIVIFKEKIRTVKKNDIKGIKKIQKYGKSIGISEKQLEFKRFWKNIIS